MWIAGTLGTGESSFLLVFCIGLGFYVIIVVEDKMLLGACLTVILTLCIEFIFFGQVSYSFDTKMVELECVFMGSSYWNFAMWETLIHFYLKSAFIQSCTLLVGGVGHFVTVALCGGVFSLEQAVLIALGSIAIRINILGFIWVVAQIFKYLYY